MTIGHSSGPTYKRREGIREYDKGNLRPMITKITERRFDDEK